MKRIGILLILCFVESLLYSQPSFPFTFKSSETKLLEQAISDGVCMMKQEYQLEDTLSFKRYTLNNRPDFGNAVSFAVLTENGYIYNENIVSPWKNDVNYRKYNDGKFRPVLSRTLVRTVGDSVWREIPLLCPATVSPMKDSGWLSASIDSLDCKGFTADYSDGKKNGWMVWLTSDGEFSDSSALSLSISRADLELIFGDADKISLAAPEGNVLGGVYLQPNFEQIGSIVLAVCGIAMKGNDGWYMVRCVQNVSENDPEIKEDVVSPKLTAVGDGSDGCNSSEENAGENVSESKEKRNKKNKQEKHE